jgi:hypothetical protein
MKLSEWIDMKLEGTSGRRTDIRIRLSIDSGVSLVTIAHVDKGMMLSNLDKARAISDATLGAVTLTDLCYE